MFERCARRSVLSVPALLVFVLLAGCGGSETPATVFGGEAMGARYHVTLVGVHPDDAYQQQIDGLLEEIESQASQWREASWLSRFNRDDALRPVEMPEHVRAMLGVADEVYRSSGGALDVTVGPVVELWGFGANPREEPPSEAELAEALERCGMDKLRLELEGGTVAKGVPGLTIDLSSLAKGYALDRISALLDELGIEDYLIAFGGEVLGRGDGPSGDGWVVEVAGDQSAGGIKQTVRLRDAACATSGGSQQRRLLPGGGVVTHLIDPRTGEPMGGSAGSVTVVSERGVVADAWATALAVTAGEDRASLAERAGVELVD